VDHDTDSEIDREIDVALETDRLGKRYGKNWAENWALRDCSLRLPRGTIAALVGPNGPARAPCCTWPSVCRRRTRTLARSSVFGAAPFDNASFLADIGLWPRTPRCPRTSRQRNFSPWAAI
jgi:ABC-2 type transport system ATP-binding protein